MLGEVEPYLLATQHLQQDVTTMALWNLLSMAT